MRVFNNSESPIEVSCGEVFAIAIQSNPSAGYTWDIDFDPSMIKMIKPQKFVAYTSHVGSGGEELFELKGNNPGCTQITFKYQRAWKKLAAPRDIKTFQVLVY